MIKKLIDLGNSIEKELNGEIKNKKDFIELCYNKLENLNFNYSLADFELAMTKWISQNKIPTQLLMYNTFGQPPLTLFNNGQFVVDVYFWMHSDTTIHSHSFAGAFKVLYGKSLHEVYKIKKIEEYSYDVQKTEAKRDSISILKQGTTHPIRPGDTFTHRIVHLDCPTVTLCIRTVNDIDVPQWHHFENGLSVLKKNLSETVYKSLAYFEYMFTRDREAAQGLLTAFISHLDNSEVLSFFELLHTDSMGLSELTLELAHDEVLAQYQDRPWFLLYQEFLELAQSYQFPESDTAKNRLLAHFENAHYSNKEIDFILTNDL